MERPRVSPAHEIRDAFQIVRARLDLAGPLDPSTTIPITLGDLQAVAECLSRALADMQ